MGYIYLLILILVIVVLYSLAIYTKFKQQPIKGITMTDSENYKHIIGTVFGLNNNFKISNTASNNIIGALNNDKNFHIFKDNFIKRLYRLNALYAQHPKFNDLLTTVQLIANNQNWEGAYAELVAFDYLNSDKNWLSDPIDLEITLSSNETLAQELGKTNTNFDGYYQDFDIYFDIKTLSDKVDSILNNVILRAKNGANTPDVLIIPEYPLDIEYDDVQNKIPELIQELKIELNTGNNPTLVHSNTIQDLSYKLLWKNKGMVTTNSTYNPYLHAENHYKLLFTHMKKFSKNRPSLIVFVVFPWFSEKVLTNNSIDKETFFRSVSRRFFMQYQCNPLKANDEFSNYLNASHTVFSVTQKLSGIIFIVDESIIEKYDDENRYDKTIKGYTYLNPNATHSLVEKRFVEHLESVGMMVDDFRYDNY